LRAAASAATRRRAAAEDRASKAIAKEAAADGAYAANALYQAALQQCADFERTDERGLEHGGSAHEMIHPRVSEQALEMPLLEVPPPRRPGKHTAPLESALAVFTSRFPGSCCREDLFLDHIFRARGGGGKAKPKTVYESG
jgi:hypothetical protein